MLIVADPKTVAIFITVPANVSDTTAVSDAAIAGINPKRVVITPMTANVNIIPFSISFSESDKSLASSIWHNALQALAAAIAMLAIAVAIGKKNAKKPRAIPNKSSVLGENPKH